MEKSCFPERIQLKKASGTATAPVVANRLEETQAIFLSRDRTQLNAFTLETDSKTGFGAVHFVEHTFSFGPRFVCRPGYNPVFIRLWQGAMPKAPPPVILQGQPKKTPPPYPPPLVNFSPAKAPPLVPSQGPAAEALAKPQAGESYASYNPNQFAAAVIEILFPELHELD